MNCGIDKIFRTFEEVANKSRPIEKIQLLEKIKDCDEFRFIAEVVYNKDIKTYVSYDVLMKKYPCGKKQIATWDEFVELVGLLTNRKIVGKEKDSFLKQFFLRCDEFHCKWYKLILAKDLRIGVGYSIIKTVLGLEDIDLGIKFTPMLAYDISSLKPEKAEELLSEYEWYWEIKIDGLRVLTVFENDTFYCYSRNSKRLVNAEKILLNGMDEKAIKALQGLVLDGEFYAKDWSKSMTSMFTKNKPIKYDPSMKYYVFDIVTDDVFKRGKSTATYLTRKDILKRIMKHLKPPFTFVDYHKLVPSTLKHAFELAHKKVEEGWEGIVLKRANSVYVPKRSKDWLKVKLFKTIDVLCTDIIPSTKNKDEISAIIFRYKGKYCKCGSGFTQEQRKQFLKNPDLIVGKIVELKYQEESKDGCLRFPVFIRVRYDKDIPDA